MKTIKLSEESKEYLDIPKKYGYKLVEKLKPTTWLILHTYPTHDTIEDGVLNGYKDALFMEIHAYDAVNMEYCIIKNRDGIDNSENIIINRVYTYKDGSTTIVIKGTDFISIDYFQSISLRKERNK